jgi:hypothetical protein
MHANNLPISVKCRLLVAPGHKNPFGEDVLLRNFVNVDEDQPPETGDGVIDGEFHLNGYISRDPRTELEEAELGQIINNAVFNIENGQYDDYLEAIVAELTDIERMQIYIAGDAARARLASKCLAAKSA